MALVIDDLQEEADQEEEPWVPGQQPGEPTGHTEALGL